MHVFRNVKLADNDALGADVEDLDHPLGVGGDAGEVGAVEDGALQGADLDDRFLGLKLGGWERQARLGVGYCDLMS